MLNALSRRVTGTFNRNNKEKAVDKSSAVRRELREVAKNGAEPEATLPTASTDDAVATVATVATVAKPAKVWRVARDPKTQRMYYYDVLTRETQWTKPLELQDDDERVAIERRQEEKRAFFSEMERNMKQNFANGAMSTDVATPKNTAGLGWRPPRQSSGSFSSEGNARMLRTLSTIDDSYLMGAAAFDLCDAQSISEAKAGVNTLDGRRRRRSLSPRSPRSAAWCREFCSGTVGSNHRKSGQLAAAFRSGATRRSASRSQDLDEPVQCLERPAMSRARNSTGTMYVDHTLSSPDRDATIRCVCHVLRAHMAACESTARGPLEREARAGKFAVFEDAGSQGLDAALPSARALDVFYRDVFQRGQMELECIVTSLIYVERLLKATRGRVKLRASNWRPIVLSCMIMASKVCDDLSMWNADFSHICRSYDLQRINALESKLLEAYGFNATVPASEYAKYYFHLRSMAARLGLFGTEALQPLDVSAAKTVAASGQQFR